MTTFSLSHKTFSFIATFLIATVKSSFSWRLLLMTQLSMFQVL